MKLISRGLVLAAGLLGVTGTADSDARHPEVAAQKDPRTIRLREYFQRRDCPAVVYAKDFILAADRHNLDWRLLPSLSMVESSGGKALKNNNIFGYDNCKTRFSSIRAGIYYVAEVLAKSDAYKDKTLDGVLRTYNPRTEYAPTVKAFMAQLGPARMAKAGNKHQTPSLNAQPQAARAAVN